MTGILIRCIVVIPVMGVLHLVMYVKDIPVLGSIALIVIVICLMLLYLRLQEIQDKDLPLCPILSKVPILREVLDLLEKIDSQMGCHIRLRMDAWPGSLRENDQKQTDILETINNLRESLELQQVHTRILKNVLVAYTERINQIQPVAPVAPILAIVS
jgi:hypothetical protein